MKHCQHCGNDFATSSSLKRHITAKHPDKHDGQKQRNARHRCPHCFEDFARRETVRRHIRSKHDRDCSICYFCSKQFRDDYMSQHRVRCALKYWERVQQHASLDNSANTAHIGSPPDSLQHYIHVLPAQSTPHLDGGGPLSLQDCTLRFVYERTIDVRLAADALTCALSFFEETSDVESYERALATALFLNITFDAQGMGPHEQRESFHDLADLAFWIRRLIRGQSTITDMNDHDMTILHHACAGGFAELLEPLFWRGASFDSIDDFGDTPLSCAMLSGDLDTVRFALALGADPNTECPLVLASCHGNHDIMTALVKHGADINGYRRGWTALEWAIHDKRLDEIRFLLSLGADPNLTINGINPVLGVVERCGCQGCDNCVHEEIALTLLEHGADVSSRDNLGHTVFHLAASHNHVRLLHAALARISSAEILAVTDDMGWTALHHAATTQERGFNRQTLDVIPMLLKAGADVNARTHEGNSALELAARDGCERIVKLLLSTEADVNTSTDHSFSVLTLAVKERQEAIVRLLIDAGVDVNAQDGDGFTALTQAAYSGHERIMQLLLKAGADMNHARNGSGTSALMVAVARRDEGMVELLLDAGADVNMQNEDVESALIQAAFFDLEWIAQLLLDARANVNTQDRSGTSALMIAARKGNEDMVQLLLDAGADVGARDVEDQTALSLAVKRANKETIRLLSNAGPGNCSSIVRIHPG